MGSDPEAKRRFLESFQSMADLRAAPNTEVGVSG